MDKKEMEKLLAKEREIVMTEEEIDRFVSNAKAIWGIEGMEISPELEEIMRDNLAGKLGAGEAMRKVLKDAD